MQELIQKLINEGGLIATSNHFSETEIAFHRSLGNMYVDENSIGYIFVSDQKKVHTIIANN